jgi:hypothetical protein
MEVHKIGWGTKRTLLMQEIPLIYIAAYNHEFCWFAFYKTPQQFIG